MVVYADILPSAHRMARILYTHDITTGAPDTSGPAAKQQTAKSSLETLLAHETFVDLPSLLEQTDTAQTSTTLLTFDDGFQSVLTEALPLLERYNVPCLLFITTGFIDRTVLPYELVLDELTRSRRAVHARVLGIPDTLMCHTSEDRQRTYTTLRPLLKHASPKRRRRVLTDLYAENTCELPTAPLRPFLTWDEVRLLDAHPLVTIGAHTVSHPVLPRQLPHVLWQELAASKRTLEHELGHAVTLMSYPYGATGPHVRFFARRAGYEYAFTTLPRSLSPHSERSLSLPRIDINSIST